jgi:hypothetical protein
MDYYGGFILQKDVNWSLLTEGLAIPISVYSRFAEWDASILTHGASKPVKIIIDGVFYEATLKNQNFDQQRYPGHKDIIQIRYAPTSLLAAKLRSVFQESYAYLSAQRQLEENRHRQLVLPSDIREYIRLYLTPSQDVFCMECCTNVEYQLVASRLSAVPEEIYEQSDDDKFFMADKFASIEEKQRMVKYRRIDRSIILSLKQFYDYRDEISGEKIGDEYGDSVVEAHHIDYFTRSQNNDSTNIIIISPNYHRIIHKNNPRFNRKKFQFEFENGEVLPLKLYDHLKIG